MYRDAAGARFTLMDTLNFHTLGLSDAQVYFCDFEPGRVAGLLRELATYIVDGATIQQAIPCKACQPTRSGARLTLPRGSTHTVSYLISIRHKHRDRSYATWLGKSE